MKTLIWKSTFEALDEGILNRLAGADVVELDAIAVGPGVHLFKQELLAPPWSIGLTTIEYNLPKRSHVTMEVYNVFGQKVRSLVDREGSAGSYTVTWDGTSTTGRPVATGVYLYRFRAGDYIETRQMVLLKALKTITIWFLMMLLIFGDFLTIF